MKRFLCVVLTLALALSVLVGCDRKFDPQQPDSRSSEPESSQAAPEPVVPEPIMPVPDLEEGGDEGDEDEQDPEDEETPDAEDEEEPDPDEDQEADGDEDADADQEGEDGDEEDGEEGEEEEEDQELDELGIPAVPHGDELAWLDFTTVTVDQLRPVLNKVLARADYFCQYGLTNKFTAGGPDPRKETAIKRKYKEFEGWTFYPYTSLPIHTLDQLEEELQTTFNWNVLTADLYYLFEVMTDDGERLYYADEVVGLCKTRGWDTSSMVIKEATEQKITLHMPTSWLGETFEADLSLRRWGGYLVLDPSYFAISEEMRASMHHAL